MGNTPTRTARRTRLVFPAFPETAAMGDTFAACFAGALAASSTVTVPMTIPLMIPTGLIPKRGIAVNSSRTTNRRNAHKIHVLTVPRAMPMGIAVLHQLRASSRTNHFNCRRLIPIQRIIPKNFVRWATVLLMLPEIISTPASRIRMNNTPASKKRLWPIAVSMTAWKVYDPACFSLNLASSIRMSISAMLNIAVTRNTAKMIHSRVMRFWRRRTRAEMGIRLR